MDDQHEWRGANPSDAGGAISPRLSRRNFLLGAGAGVLLCGLGAVSVYEKNSLVRPPGGQNRAQLIGRCIHCAKCLESCPHHIIKPAHIENGLVQMRTPYLDFSNSWCDWCHDVNGGVPLCVEACPTGALSLPEGATEETVLLGKAELITDWCLAYKNMGCRFCYDECAFEAIKLDEESRPYLVLENCNGCGACQAVCVSEMHGALSVGAASRAITVKVIQE